MICIKYLSPLNKYGTIYWCTSLWRNTDTQRWGLYFMCKHYGSDAILDVYINKWVGLTSGILEIFWEAFQAAFAAVLEGFHAARVRFTNWLDSKLLTGHTAGKVAQTPPAAHANVSMPSHWKCIQAPKQICTIINMSTHTHTQYAQYPPSRSLAFELHILSKQRDATLSFMHVFSNLHLFYFESKEGICRGITWW